MVTVEPFFYQKTTAFKERVQMINKINEIIESLNGVFDEEQVKEYVANELLNYYTKEEVDDAIDSIDLSPYATKTYVDDAIDSIDLSPYATNERVDDEVETLDDKIDTKQDIVSAVSPIGISNNEISIDSSKIIESATDLDTSFYIKATASKPLKICDSDPTTGSNKMVLMFLNSAIKFIDVTNGNYSKVYGNIFGNKISSGALATTRYLSISSPSKSNETSPTITVSFINIPRKTNIGVDIDKVIGLQSGDLYSGFVILGGGNEIGEFIGLSSYASGNNVTRKRGLLIDYRGLNYIVEGTEYKILNKVDMPTGKTVTDTVTFQDLIDMGFVNSP